MKYAFAFLLGVLTVAGVQSLAQHATTPHARTGMTMPMHGQSGQLMGIMHASMGHMMGLKMTGNLDRDFAAMMIEHHRSGVAMAKVELASGHDPVLKNLARNIVTSQTKEIATMGAELAKLAKAR